MSYERSRANRQQTIFTYLCPDRTSFPSGTRHSFDLHTLGTYPGLIQEMLEYGIQVFREFVKPKVEQLKL